MSKRIRDRFPPTDAGNAELIAHLYGRRLRFDYSRRRWFIFKEGHWQQDSDGEARRLAKAAARERAKAALKLKDDDDREAASKWALQSEHEYRIKAALSLAESTHPLADDGKHWDSEPFLLGVRNGVLNMRTGKLREGRPEDQMIQHSHVLYDPSAECPRFEQFLEEVFFADEEMIRHLQKAIGYSLTGDVTEQCVFLCYGEGANGKSTLLEIVASILGTYALNLPFSSFETKARSGIPNDLAQLPGKRFVTASETSENAALNESRVKSITGGDTITARFLYGENFSFRPTSKIWLAFNHKPRVTDNSYGFWRRVRLIPFRAQFSGVQSDKSLSAKLQAEGTGILAWAVRGCLAWQKEGLGEPAILSAATKAYREESDPLATFLEDRYEQAPMGCVGSTDILEDYGEWARANGEEALTARSLALRLASHGFTAGRDTIDGQRVRVWRGLQRICSPSDALGSEDTRTGSDTTIQ